jgi:putative membrane protein
LAALGGNPAARAKTAGEVGDDFAGQQRRNWKYWVESLRRAPPRPSRPLATERQWGRPSPAALTLFTGDTMIPLSEFPAIDATLNATSALLLTLGYFFIRRKRIQAHKVCMLSAFATSSLFLVCYIWYHAHHGVTRFPRHGAVRDLYLALLGSHTILAVVIVPLILTTLYRAWRGRFERHKKIARWTLPLWFYVSVTGVVVYWMLYHLYAQVVTH